MNIRDPISDMINRIRIAQFIRLKYVFLFYYNIVFSILKILKNEGYIKNFFMLKTKFNYLLVVELKYYKSQPVIQFFKRVSKSSCRVYKSCKNLPKVMNGLGISIISTTFGIITGEVSKTLGIGGEVICYVF